MLYDINFRTVSDGGFEYTVNTPINVSDCSVRTVVWDSLSQMQPKLKGYTFK